MVVCDAVCAVRCICVEGAPAPGRRWGAGDSDGCEGDLQGNPSSHHCSAWEAAGSRERRYLWALCQARSLSVTPRDETNTGCYRLLRSTEPSQPSPSFSHHLQPNHLSPLTFPSPVGRICACKPLFIRLLLIQGASQGCALPGPPSPPLRCRCPVLLLGVLLLPVGAARWVALFQPCPVEQRGVRSCC